MCSILTINESKTHFPKLIDKTVGSLYYGVFTLNAKQMWFSGSLFFFNLPLCYVSIME